jgi:hypothetical protein
MKKMLFATLFAAATAAPAVYASAYIGLAVAPGNADVYLNDGFTTLKSENSPVPLNGYAGYAFHPNFAVEGGISYFGEFRFSEPPTALFGIFHLAIKGTMNLNDKWLLTGKAGVARHGLTIDVPNASGTRSYNFHTTRPMFGVGTEYRFTDHVSATLEFVNYGTGNTPEMRIQARSFEAGIKYRF